jgi:DNA-binding transcriptional ArsR family regulator
VGSLAEEDKGVGRVALRIYVILLESSEPLGVRDIARMLDIPVSTAYYHLKKLEDLGIVKPVGLGYTIANPLKLEDYIVLGRRLVPKLIIYSFFFLGVVVGELLLILARRWVTYDSVIVIVVGLLAFIILFYEGFRLRQRLWH